MPTDNVFEMYTNNNFDEISKSIGRIPGGGDGGGMDQRLTALEGRMTRVEDRLTGVETRLAVVETKLQSIDDNVSIIRDDVRRVEAKLITEWQMAKVIFFVIAAMMGAAFFAPRLLAMLGT